jgi:hypothetical protein
MDASITAIISNPAASLRIFGVGFLAGSLFAVLIMLIFDWVRSKNSDSK